MESSDKASDFLSESRTISRIIEAPNAVFNQIQEMRFSEHILEVYWLRNQVSELAGRTLKRMVRPWATLNIHYSSFSGHFDPYMSGDADILILDIDFDFINGQHQEYVSNLISSISNGPHHLTNLSRIAVIHSAEESQIAVEIRRRLFKILGEKTPIGLFLTKRVGLTRDSTSHENHFGLASQIVTSTILPSIKPELRAIIVDLDDTLYSGNLVDDGVGSIHFSPSHRKILAELKEASTRGALVCIASQNSREEVEELLRSGQLEPLTRTDFSIVEANLDPKTTKVARILSLLNFSAHHVQFLDDNSHNLASVASEFPSIELVLASNPDEIARFLKFATMPRVRKSEAADAEKRKVDIQSNVKRRELNSKNDPLHSLQTKIFLSDADEQNIPRVLELATKTNQFNTSLSRPTISELIDWHQSSNHKLVVAEISDQFSHSGIVGFLVATTVASRLVCTHLGISCRALNRGIDQTIFNEIAYFASSAFDVEGIEMHVLFKPGPKNSVAKTIITTSPFVTIERGRLLFKRALAEKSHPEVEVYWNGNSRPRIDQAP